MKNIKHEIFILLLFVIMRLPNLGGDIFNTDVWKWKARSYDFGTGVFTLNFEKTIQKYHPGVTLMWIGTAGIKIYNIYHENFLSGVPFENNIDVVFGIHFVQKFLVLLVIGLSLCFIFRALKKIVDTRYAYIATFFLMFEPFYLALTRVFHLEGLMSTFMIASALYLFVYLYKAQKLKYLVFSAVFSALAILTKTSALFMIPFAVLTIFLNKKNILFTLKTFGYWLVGVFGVFLVLWPALWTNFSQAIRVLYRGISVIGIERDHSQLYFGNLVHDPGPSFYFVVLAFRVSLVLIIGLIGYFTTRKRLNVPKFVSFLLIFTIFYLIQLTIPSKKLDRYILPSIMSLSLISSFYFYYLFKNKRYMLVPVLLISLFTTVYLHPSYFSYYNPLLGGLKTGMRVIEPKWMIGSDKIVTYFKEVKEAEGFTSSPKYVSMESLITSEEINNILTVGFPEKYYTQVWPFFRKIDSWAVIKDLTRLANHTKYFVYPVWSDTSGSETRYQIDYIDTIKLRGVEVYNVYKNEDISF